MNYFCNSSAWNDIPIFCVDASFNKVVSKFLLIFLLTSLKWRVETSASRGRSRSWGRSRWEAGVCWGQLPIHKRPENDSQNVCSTFWLSTFYDRKHFVRKMRTFIKNDSKTSALHFDEVLRVWSKTFCSKNVIFWEKWELIM